MPDDGSDDAVLREQLKITELFGTLDESQIDSEEELRAQRKGQRFTEEELQILAQSVQEHPLTATDPRRQLLAAALYGSLKKTGEAAGRDLTQELLDDRREEAAKKGW